MCLPMDVKNVYLAAESLYWATESITPAENNFLPRKKFFPPEGVLFSSRGKFCPPGTRQSHIVSIFRPCANQPLGEESFMTSGDIPVAHIVSGGTSVSERALPACTGSLPGWAPAQRPWQSDTPGMIVNSGTPHRGMNVHMTDDNMEKIGKFPCSVGGKSVTLHANSGFTRDI